MSWAVPLIPIQVLGVFLLVLLSWLHPSLQYRSSCCCIILAEPLTPIQVLGVFLLAILSWLHPLLQYRSSCWLYFLGCTPYSNTGLGCVLVVVLLYLGCTPHSNTGLGCLLVVVLSWLHPSLQYRSWVSSCWLDR